MMFPIEDSLLFNHLILFIKIKQSVEYFFLKQFEELTTKKLDKVQITHYSDPCDYG